MANYAIQHKRGDSFSQIIPISPTFPEGALREWVVSSQIRVARDNTFISDLECSWVDPNTTRFILLTQNNTSDWPVGPAMLDIQFKNSDGFAFSSETISVLINKEITY